ncbi:MAG: hypothetical protein II855_07540 [Candidatus Methanomethylophilaceae archaeon]|nr:hypothetical protein [Candidatus Methanomethylophilaceae archaeon]
MTSGPQAMIMSYSWSSMTFCTICTALQCSPRLPSSVQIQEFLQYLMPRGPAYSTSSASRAAKIASTFFSFSTGVIGAMPMPPPTTSILSAERS